MRLSALLVAALLLVPPQATERPALGTAERIADGVLLYQLDDQDLLSPPGPVAVHALQIDPRKVRLAVALAAARRPARETVASIATRRGALAAVNGGFFVLADGKPTGILKAGGKIKGWTSRPRGAVALLKGGGGTPPLLFDRVIVPRTKGTPAYRTQLGSNPAAWARAPDIVGGAGLLVLDSAEIDDWTEEKLSEGFDTTRHPRTMIGVDDRRDVWLITVDGRQPALSLGMNFAELKGLARRIGLRSALNLDGGGSTTMVVRGGRIVNHPSDPTGPRPVSDAILALRR